jgi:hypothetical protein
MPCKELISFLERFGPEAKTGMLEVYRPSTSDYGQIFLSSGHVIYATTGVASDRKAVLSMLAWGDGEVKWRANEAAPRISSQTATDLFLFEFSQLEDQLGSDEAVLAYLNQDTSGSRKRRTVHLNDLSTHAIQLRITSPDVEAVTFDLQEGIQHVGKGRDCEVCIIHDSISRMHCRITVNKSAVALLDLGSTNGTYINDEIITEKVAVPGDKVTFGSVTCVLSAKMKRKLARTTASLDPETNAALSVDKAIRWGNSKATAPTPNKEANKSLLGRLFKNKKG